MGDRYYPIILCDGKQLSDEWWQFLLAYDPDVIKSLVPLSDELIKKIERYLSPYHVEVPHRQQDTISHINLVDEGLSILPTPENVASIARSFDNRHNLVLFGVDKISDSLIKRFISNNIGIYARSLAVEKELGNNHIKSFDIDSKESLSMALEQLSTFERFVYPIQICSLPNYFSDINSNNNSNEAFTVIIGNTLDDIVYAWNHQLYIPHWKRNQLMQVWIPAELIDDTNVETGLKKWLQRVADPGGSTHERVNFISLSLDQKELEEKVNLLTKDLWLIKHINSLSKIPVPTYRDDHPFLRLKEGLDLIRAAGDKEQIIVKDPDVLEGTMGGEHWVADSYIQLKSDLYKNFVNKDWWYQLPRKNMLAHQIFHKPSRISAKGLPSIIMKRGDNELSINLLNSTSTIRSLLVCANTPAYTDDPRVKFTKSPFYTVDRSDKGRYLTGFIDIFDGLFNSYHILQEKYWRKMFDLLASYDPGKDEQKIQEINNKLQKKTKEFLSSENGNKWLANYVIYLAKTVSTSSRELPFQRFDQEAQEEIKRYNESHEQKFRYNSQDVKDAITDLMENGILLAGVKNHCPACGIANWYKLDNLNQYLKCNGCGTEFSFEAETKWYYRLNHLVLNGHAYHGLTPVILVLGQMLEESGTCFMVSPSLWLYKNRNSKKPIGELDIICIQDGKFIIGEVKQSIDGFTPAEFKKMGELAKKILPDKVIFSSVNQGINKTVREQIQILKTDLNQLGIEVEWYQLHDYIFKPSPVR